MLKKIFFGADSSDFQNFRALVDELKIMSYLRPHINVLGLVGACTSGVDKRQLFVLTEYCENGSLRNYLVENYIKFEGFEINAVGQFIVSNLQLDILVMWSIRVFGVLYNLKIILFLQ